MFFRWEMSQSITDVLSKQIKRGNRGKDMMGYYVLKKSKWYKWYQQINVAFYDRRPGLQMYNLV